MFLNLNEEELAMVFAAIALCGTAVALIVHFGTRAIMIVKIACENIGFSKDEPAGNGD